MTFADTSFLVSLYVQDANSSAARRIANSLAAPFAYTFLHRLEIRNAIRLAAFRKDITFDDGGAVLKIIDDDEKAGVLLSTSVDWGVAYAEAESMSAQYTETLGTRAFDVLHLAVAVVLGAKTFHTFNLRQKTLAKKLGFKVKP